MDPAIFITHSSKDQKVARTICTALENRGLACWISSRNIKPGQNYQEQIVKAIRAAKIMVLVFTANANNSNEIKKELALASQNNLVVIPVRIEDVTPNEAFAYEFATRQWIDLFDDWEQSIAHLVELIAGAIDDHPSVGRAFVAADCADTVGAAGSGPAPRTKVQASRRALLMVAAFVVVLVGLAGIWLAEMDWMQAQPPPVHAAVGAIGPLSPDRERALRPKDSFTECERCPEMVVVPAGAFTMGSPGSELGHHPDEDPQHRVTIAQPFAVGRYAVTFDEWDECVVRAGCKGYNVNDNGWGRGRRPVIRVSWDDAKTYVSWLSQKTGKPYRLLSEAEREYVTRAGTTTPFWWGSSITTNQANYDGGHYTYGPDGAIGEFRAKTLPVDSFEPNPWGLYQVHGNVFDWVEDCYHDGYIGAPSDGSAWTGADYCRVHVLRGGAWSFLPQVLRSAVRYATATDNQNASFGFRVARTLAP